MPPTPSSNISTANAPGFRIAWYAGTAALLLSLSWSLQFISWTGDAYFHRMIETAAGMIAVMIGVMALTRHYSRRDSSILLLGTAFVGTGILDIYHGILTSPGLIARLPFAAAGVVPWTWLSSRLFLAFMLIGSWLVWRHERRFGLTGWLPESMVYGFAVTLMTASGLAFFFLPLPRASFPEWPVPRPQELIGAILFLIAFILHVKKGEWKTSRYEHWLIVGILVECLDHAVIMARSIHLHDVFFNAAHIVKPAGYLCVLTGLVINMYELFTRLEVSVTEARLADARLRDAHRELEQRVRERTAQLDESQRFVNSVVEHLPHMVFVKDARDLRFVQFNKAGETLTGLSREELLGRTDYDVFPPDQADVFTETDRAALAKGAMVEIQEERIHTRRHGIRLLRTKKIPICNGQGSPQFLLGISEDITEQKQADEALRLSEERLRLTLSVATDGLWDWDIPTMQAYYSPSWIRLLGLEDHDIPLNNIADWKGRVHPDDRPRLEQALSEHLEGRTPAYVVEHRIRHRSGEWKWFEIRGQIIQRDAQGRPLRMVGTMIDIDERAQSEAAAEQSRALLQAFVLHAPAAVAMLDRDLRYVAVSHRWLHDYNLGDRSIIGLHHYDVFPEVRQMTEWQDIHRRCLLGAVERREEDRFVRGDGIEQWLRWEVRPWHDRQGAIGGIIMFTEDITPRKHTEETLRRMQFSVEQAVDAVYWIDPHAHIRYVNQAACRMLGYSQDELLALTVHDLNPTFHADQWPSFWADTKAHPLQAFETQHRAKDGRLVPVEIHVNFLSHEGQEFHCAFVRDITERKRAEEERTKHASLVSLMLNTGPGCIKRVAANGTLLQMNQAGLKLIEAGGEEEAVGQCVFDLVVPEHRNAFIDMHRDVLAGRPRTLQFEICGLKGTRRWMETHAVPFRNPVSGETEQLAVTLDVTDRLRADKARLTLQHAVNHGKDGLALLDSSGCFTYMNPALAAMYGYTADELLGKTWAELFHPDWVSLIEQLSRPDLIESGSWQGEVVGKKRSGDPFHVEMSLAIIGADNENGATMVWTCRDITKRKTMEQDLVAAKDAAEMGARAKAEFLATMSHEIRTPMNGVIGMTGLLLDTTLTREQRDYAETVRRSGEVLLSIINDILDFSKIEAGKLALEIIDFDLRATVEETLDLLAEQAHRKELELVGLIDASVPTALRGDPGRLRQIITNLVGNAIKFTERGEVVVRVEAASEPPGEGHKARSKASSIPAPVALKFSITDTGIGISPEGQSRLFQSFSQADGSTTRRFGGTGLGLAISKQLVEKMGGEISVSSQPGRGSTFWFTVKLEPQSAAQAPLLPIRSLAGLSVCLIDDNATNRLLLEHHARMWEMTHASAENGQKALEVLREGAASGHAFDLALVDMEMPGMDGMELARRIHGDPALRSTRLVLLTSLARRGDAKLAQDRGFSAYLTKPIHQHQLYDCLRLVMGRSDGQPSTEHQLITVHRMAEIQARNSGRILLAEDNVINQKVAVKMIEKLGYHVDVVANGEEALEALSRIPYVLVFMDCQMPEMDGYEATRRIRAREAGFVKREPSESDTPYASRTTNDASPKAPHVPIVAMTANAMQGDREHCLAAGMDDYVSKPIAAKNIQTVLERWLTPSSSAAPV